jgi:hypothetical protein
MIDGWMACDREKVDEVGCAFGQVLQVIYTS